MVLSPSTILPAPRQGPRASMILDSQDLKSLVAGDLELVERAISQVLARRPPRLTGIIDHVSEYRGKRFRPLLALLTARVLGCDLPGRLDLAVAMEMMHTASLVHDDILDNAETRRHIPTVHSRWGCQSAVLLGDYLFSHAFVLAAKVGDSQVTFEVAETARKVCEGELKQNLEAGNWLLPESDYMEIIEGKTAELMAASCRLMGVFARADSQTCSALDTYGRSLGMAFQMADDLLDLEGDEETTGKSLGTDLEQGKVTLPIIHALCNAQPAQKSALLELLKATGAKSRSALRKPLEATGSLAYTRRKAEDFVGNARRALASLPESPYRQALLNAADRALHRAC
jgi:octaprenyl-diphosphate synthase